MTKEADKPGVQSSTSLPAGPNELLFEIEYRLQALAALAAAIGREVATAVAEMQYPLTLHSGVVVGFFVLFKNRLGMYTLSHKLLSFLEICLVIFSFIR